MGRDTDTVTLTGSSLDAAGVYRIAVKLLPDQAEMKVSATVRGSATAQTAATETPASAAPATPPAAPAKRAPAAAAARKGSSARR